MSEAAAAASAAAEEGKAQFALGKKRSPASSCRAAGLWGHQAKPFPSTTTKTPTHTHAGDFPAAIAAWTRAVEALSSGVVASSSSPTSTAAPELKARCLANRAQAWLQLRDYGAAERDCGASLRLVPNNAKALLRRATVGLIVDHSHPTSHTSQPTANY